MEYAVTNKATLGVVEIGGLHCGSGQPLLLILGPCVIQSRDLTLSIAEQLRSMCSQLQMPLVFKASFDKANRTSRSGYRGLGIDAGLRILEEVRRDVGLPTVTDVHLPQQANAVAEVCDLLQIPAFLARQTDLLEAAAATGRPLNVKKGQFMAPLDMQYVLDKVYAAGQGGCLLCERGTFFGYGRLVNDMQALPLMRGLGAPVIFDATHSVQQPGGLGGATGGNRAMVEPLARAAVATGIDGLFLETHPDPDTSPSDGANMVPLDALPHLLNRIKALSELVRSWP
ncbi:MAG: 3-deoxy-8-phosphooctulonate synthase [Pirellulaceae bacterium]|nr:3-deoxy-8-phosphooctulonate synthase [Pirellulaceae bacterium]